ncbi:MAG: hypothetical protein ACRC0J_05650 [Shewanella oncorhynchi]
MNTLLLTITLLLNPVPMIEQGLLLEQQEAKVHMNKEQLRKLVIEPVLVQMDMYSDEAVRLLLMIVAHESQKGYYISQVRGPAKGIYQMEPATHDDVRRFLRAKLKILKVDKFRMVGAVTDTSDEMVGNLYYATAMARAFFLRFPEALPKGSDYELAVYAKRRWNTIAGKATAEDYLRAYQSWK